MTEDYIEAQKSIINSVFDSSIPYYENVQRMYNNWLSPRVQQSYGQDQSAILQKTFQQQQE